MEPPPFRPVIIIIRVMLNMPVLRLTLQVQLVLAAFLADPDQPRYAYELTGPTGLKSPSVSVIIARLARHGLLEADPDASRARSLDTRPDRRYYRLTAAGRDYGPLALDGLRTAADCQRAAAQRVDAPLP